MRACGELDTYTLHKAFTHVMTEVLGNAIIFPIVVSYLYNAKDVARLCQISRVVRATALSMLRHSTSARLSFKDTKVKSKVLLKDLQVMLWRHLELLDLRGCSSVTSSIIKPIFCATKISILLISDCVRINALSIIQVLESMKKAIDTGKKQRADFAPVGILDPWNIEGLMLDCQYQGKAEWLNSYRCPYNKNLVQLIKIGELLSVRVTISWCPCGPQHEFFGEGQHTGFAARANSMYQACARARFLNELLGNDPVFFGLEAHPCPACLLRLHALDHEPLPARNEEILPLELDKVFREACDGRCQRELPLENVNWLG
jgi:hypothetical protein